MNHHERSGDSGSARKIMYPLSLPKRESSGGTVSGSSALTAPGSTSSMVGDDYTPPVLIQTQAPAPSSLGPPQSLNISLQTTLVPQALPTAVAQMKKKSGFQITSVTPAQTSVSTNNSITEDTESCDDLDESHTEDLSSSEIMDVSLPRTNNVGGPERSSSEETLNNFHEAETPGALSPNQPPAITQPHLHGTMVNGTVHNHHHLHHHNAAPSGKVNPAGVPLPAAVAFGVPVSSGALPSTGQKVPSGVVENTSVGKTAAIGQTLATVTSGAGMIPVTSGATTSTGAPVSVLNSTIAPAAGVTYPSALNSLSNQTVNLTHISGISGVGMAASTAVSGGSASTGGGQMGPVTPVPMVNAQAPQAPVPNPASTSSRFRVVKLDSTSEPFKKGRWTCTEYYDKESQSAVSSENVASTRTVESIRQFVPESVACLEKDAVSGSTASHYTESLGSGETVGSSAVKQTLQQPTVNATISQMQPQDLAHVHIKTNPGASMPATQNVQQQPLTSIGVLQTTIGHSSGAVSPHMPKLTYAQAAQSSSQALPLVPQQQMGYTPAQQPAAPSQVAPTNVLNPGGLLPTDFPQSKLMNATPTGSTKTQPLPTGSIPPVQQSLGTGQPPSAQPVPQGVLQPQQIVQVVAQLVQSAGTGLILQPQGPSMEQQLTSQVRGTQFAPPVTSSRVPLIQSDAQSSLIQNGLKETGTQAAVSSRLSMMSTPLEDAQLLLLQHQALLAQAKPSSGESSSQTGISRGPDGISGVNALSASAGLLKSLPVDGEDDG
ncbi:hypothetical protein DNTS_030955 [Danionella cerebrum]|uniref:TSC22 domain family protein 1 n=1 Tax=Danionella cerebrum TaxID=2873325 RepID=A0A553MXN5_9TELE|nr:hypothetical protein DNTS_030955 [Danionella translucida]